MRLIQSEDRMCLRLAIAYMSGYESYPLIFMWSEEVTMGLLELFLLAIGLSMDAFAEIGRAHV